MLVIKHGITLLANCIAVQRKAEFQEHYNAGAIYVLSMAWFREWENFVCCKTDGLFNTTSFSSSTYV